jgi:hypothetical protein
MITEGITAEHLAQVYTDTRIVGAIEHDHRPAAPINHPAVTYLSAWAGRQFAGAFLAIRTCALEIELHSLLHRFAVRHSRDLGRAAIAWAFSQGVEHVAVQIIQGLESVRNYCRKLGMSEEGRRRSVCQKGGALLDVYVMGITRKEFEGGAV